MTTSASTVSHYAWHVLYLQHLEGNGHPMEQAPVHACLWHKPAYHMPPYNKLLPVMHSVQQEDVSACGTHKKFPKIFNVTKDDDCVCHLSGLGQC